MNRSRAFAPLLVVAMGSWILLQGQPPASEQQRSWSLQNDLVERVLTYNARSGLQTTSWIHRESRTEMARMPPTGACSEFSIQADGQEFSPASKGMQLSGTPAVWRSGNELRLDLIFVPSDAPLAITAHYSMRDGFAAVRQWLTIENRGPKPIALSHVIFACGFLQPAPASDLIAFGHYGEQPRETFFTARVNDVLPMVESAVTGVGYAVLNEAPGYLRRTEIGTLGQWQPSFAAMYDTDLFPYARTLHPQERLETAAASVLLYHRGQSDDPHWTVAEYVRQVLQPPGAAHRPPVWFYNDWEPWNGTATASLLQQVLPRAAQLGLNLATIDEGWEQTLGDNTPSAARFPHGLEPIFAQARSLGMDAGLWLPVALVGTQSETYRSHPEWACLDRSGLPKIAGDRVVMNLASPYRESAYARILEAVQRYRLDYIKLDLTTVFNTYGQEPGCYPSSANAPSSAESAVLIYENLEDIADRLHGKFPNLQIDYTFELWGEKHLIDYGLLRHADLDWLSNVADHASSDAGPLQVRTLLYQRALAIPSETMLIGNLQPETGDWQECVATAMGSAPVFLGDLRSMPRGFAGSAARWVTRFRELRAQVPLNQSFFPLGSWQQPHRGAWDGFGRFSTRGEGLIVLFRNGAEHHAAPLVIPGFPQGRYRLSNWASSASLPLNGEALRKGWTYTFRPDENVAILEVRAVAVHQSESSRNSRSSTLNASEPARRKHL